MPLSPDVMIVWDLLQLFDQIHTLVASYFWTPSIKLG